MTTVVPSGKISPGLWVEVNVEAPPPGVGSVQVAVFSHTPAAVFTDISAGQVSVGSAPLTVITAVSSEKQGSPGVY